MQQSARFGIEHYSQLKELCNKKWDYHNAFFFTGTLATTIGYGNLVPKTDNGRIFCLCFCLIGESHMQGPPNTERWVFAVLLFEQQKFQDLPNSQNRPNSSFRPKSPNSEHTEQCVLPEQLKQSEHLTGRTVRLEWGIRTANRASSPNTYCSDFGGTWLYGCFRHMFEIPTSMSIKRSC